MKPGILGCLPPITLDNYSPRGPITPPRATPGWPAAMSAHKHFQAERLQALPTGPTGGHLAGSLELPRLGRTTVPRLRRGWAGQRLPLQPAAYLGCVYILTHLAEPPHPAAFPSAGWALRSLFSPQAGAPPSSTPPSSTLKLFSAPWGYHSQD